MLGMSLHLKENQDFCNWEITTQVMRQTHAENYNNYDFLLFSEIGKLPKLFSGFEA